MGLLRNNAQMDRLFEMKIEVKRKKKGENDGER
jgi:hypothetical protein